MNPTVTIGRLVHYVEGTQTIPALITEVLNDQEDLVHLTLFAPLSTRYASAVDRADEPTPGKWHWPRY